jgi:cytochrome c-type biogenesis protein CcmH/NrfG
VDVGYLLALEIANDQHHQTAVQHWQWIVSMLPPLLTTSYSPSLSGGFAQ